MRRLAVAFSMFLIFSIADRKTKHLGNTGLMDCPRCNNTSAWAVHQEKTYFSIFFIPLIPYRTEYLLSCPVCRETRAISEEEKNRLLPRVSE
jgi:ssDNA-binding Zn-finger/Zn-ribbon topoisomerase 1